MPRARRLPAGRRCATGRARAGARRGHAALSSATREGRRAQPSSSAASDYATNVLSFPYGTPLGATSCSARRWWRARRASRERAVRAHYAHLLVHGVLHLRGYDHERAQRSARMEAREVPHPRALGLSPIPTTSRRIIAAHDERTRQAQPARAPFRAAACASPRTASSSIELLRSAYERNLLDADALSIIEGALRSPRCRCATS